MQVFTVHVKQGFDTGGMQVELVKEGFRFWAAIFGPIWAAAQGLWLEAAGLFGLWMLADGLLYLSGLSAGLSFVLWLGFMAIFGYLAGPLHRWALDRRGYVFWDVVAAEDDLSAARRVFDSDGPALRGYGS